MNNYIEVEFNYITTIDTNIINDILASELGEIGFESFTEDTNGLHGYIPDKLYNKEILKEKLLTFPLPNVQITFNTKEIISKDWNEEWEKNYFKPIRIGQECIIRSSFHKNEPEFTYNIIINPKMAFGSGNHATTYLMINEMLKLNLEGKSLLDMGCGTAVLAILASMKGANNVTGIDIDEWAYNNALENIHINHIDTIKLLLGGAEKLQNLGQFDYIFANINRNILLKDICHYAKKLKQNSSLYMSGFYKEDLPLIETECNKYNIKLLSYTERDKWIAVKALKK